MLSARIVALAILLACGCNRRAAHERKEPPRECPTQEKFEALKDGMSREDVEGFLGMQGVVKADSGGTQIVNYMCLGPKRRITATYTGGSLRIKTADGL